MKKITTGKKILFSIIIVTIFFLVLEKSISVYDKVISKKIHKNPAEKARQSFLNGEQEKDYYECHKLEPYPYVMFRVHPNFNSKTININSRGFRGKEFSDEKKEDIYRIVGVGGSGAWGAVATSDDKTFTSLMENILNKNNLDKKVEVLNLGVPSYNSSQELILIAQHVIKLRPDVVIIYDGFNDTHFSVVKDRRPGFPFLYAEYEKIINTPPFKMIIERTLNKIRIVKKMRGVLNAHTAPDYSPNHKAIKVYGDNLDLMCHLLKSYNIKPYIILQPIIHEKEHLTPSESAVISLNDSILNKTYIEMYSEARKIAQDVCEKNGVGFIDGATALKDTTDTVFHDNVHLNDAGQKIIAKYICDSIAKRLN